MKNLRKINFIFIMAAFFIAMSISFACAGTEQWEREDNDYAGSADVVTVATGNSIKGIVNDSDDVDWYKFTLKKGSKVVMKHYGNVYLKIYKKTPGEEDPDYINGYDTSYNNNLGYYYDKDSIYLSKGQYYIKVTEGDGYAKINKYTIFFSNVKMFGTEQEPNNYVGQAQKANSGVVYCGVNGEGEEICWFDGWYWNRFYDPDYYKLPERGYYYVTLRNIEGDSDYDLDLTTYDNEGNFKEATIEDLEIGKKETKLIYNRLVNRYRICADYEGTGMYKVSFTKKPSKIANVIATKYSAKAIKVKWNKRDGVTGYKIYRSGKKSGTYKLIGTVKGANKTSFIDKNKKKGKTYFYKVCAYQTVNGVVCKGFRSNAASKRL